jgi:hypothetical protein
VKEPSLHCLEEVLLQDINNDVEEEGGWEGEGVALAKPSPQLNPTPKDVIY